MSPPHLFKKQKEDYHFPLSAILDMNQNGQVGFVVDDVEGGEINVRYIIS